MELFIQIKNGEPYEHPIFGDNFKEAFPHIDTVNLPPEFARFERIECPRAAGVYEVDVVSYEWADGIVKDVWSVRPMNEEEKIVKRAQLTDFVNRKINTYKNIVQEFLALDSTTEAQKDAYRAYIAELDLFVFDDPLTAVVPPVPAIAKDGTILSVNVPGTAPSVTG